jgi:hypothetical protein
MWGCDRPDIQLVGKLHMPCCTSGQPCKHGPRDTNSVRPESRPQGSWSNIEWQDLGSGTMTRLGGITNRVVEGPLHVKDYPRPPVRTRFWPFRAACSRSIYITKDSRPRSLTSFCCSYTWPIWNQISACASGLGGFRKMRSKHTRLSSYLPCCL